MMMMLSDVRILSNSDGPVIEGLIYVMLVNYPLCDCIAGSIAEFCVCLHVDRVDNMK